MSMLLGLLLVQSPAASAQPASSPWSAIQFMVGEWEGESEGQPGKGTVRRTYGFVLGDKFLHEQNVSTYPPQPKNQKGEVHEHRSFFSHDRARRTLVLRQFHQEGFVNQYVMLAGSPAGTIVFESEALENVPPHVEGAGDVPARLAGRVRRDLRALLGRGRLRGLQQGPVQARPPAIALPLPRRCLAPAAMRPGPREWREVSRTELHLDQAGRAD